jgi:hypothetical protein
MSEGMQANIISSKSYELVNKAIDRLMVASGTISLVWILAFLLVAMIEK